MRILNLFFRLPRFAIICCMVPAMWCFHVPELQQASATEDKHVIGWVEKVTLLPENINVHAKIDTGADHSSLNVEEKTEFIRRGEQWVRFSFIARLDTTVTLTRKIYRYTKVKQKAGASQRRPVVLLDLCGGGIVKHDMQVNLADRTNFTYDMLIGRSFLSNTFIVDPSIKYSANPACIGMESLE